MHSETGARVWDCNFRTELFRPDTQCIGLIAELSGVSGFKFLVKPSEVVAGQFSTRFMEKKLLTTGASVFKKLFPKVWEGFVPEDGKKMDSQAAKEISLIELFNDAYGQMAKDKAYRGVHSAIPFCYAPGSGHVGHGFAYIPEPSAEKTGEKSTPSIVFLHGSMGNLLWNIWALVAEFPDHIILAPSGGYEWPSQNAEIVAEYVDEMRSHVESKFNVEIDRPWLMALSQGGSLGFKIAAHAPERFSGFVSLASCPVSLNELQYPPDFPILMINGTSDDRFDISHAESCCRDLSAKRANIEMKKILGANHFFYLSRRAEMAALIRNNLIQSENPLPTSDQLAIFLAY